MTKLEAIKHFGNQSRLAEALGLSRQAISLWVWIPARRQRELEKITHGKLLADCPPEALA